MQACSSPSFIEAVLLFCSNEWSSIDVMVDIHVVELREKKVDLAKCLGTA